MNNLIKNVEAWGGAKGITGPNGKATPKAQYKKLLEEVGELGMAIGENDTAEIIDGIGDATVVLILLADMQGLTLEYCLQSAYDVIAKRKGQMVNGVFVKEVE